MDDTHSNTCNIGVRLANIDASHARGMQDSFPVPNRAQATSRVLILYNQPTEAALNRIFNEVASQLQCGLSCAMHKDRIGTG
jgi:hypothetical protein